MWSGRAARARTSPPRFIPGFEEQLIGSKTGDEKYRERLAGAGSVYASLLAADGKLYAVTRRNGTFVLAAGPEFRQIAHNELASRQGDFNASPAVSGGRLILRSDSFLYSIGGSAD